MEGNIIIATPPLVFLIWFPPPLPFALPNSLCPSFRSNSPSRLLVGGRWEGTILWTFLGSS